MNLRNRAETFTLTVLLATAGTFIGVGILTEQAGRAWQWLGREIDRAFVARRL